MREINEVIKYAKKLNFKVSKTRNNHYVFEGFGHKLYTASTTSDYRVFMKIRRSLFKMANNTFVKHN